MSAEICTVSADPANNQSCQGDEGYLGFGQQRMQSGTHLPLEPQCTESIPVAREGSRVAVLQSVEMRYAHFPNSCSVGYYVFF
jgi:hypothetical protein